MAKKYLTAAIILLVINIIFSLFVLYVQHQYFGRFYDVHNHRQRLLSVGMYYPDVISIAGEPQEVVTRKEYEKLIKERPYVPGKYSIRYLKMPVENKVLIYQPGSDNYFFVFINNQDRVGMILDGNSDILPHWY